MAKQTNAQDLNDLVEGTTLKSVVQHSSSEVDALFLYLGLANKSQSRGWHNGVKLMDYTADGWIAKFLVELGSAALSNTHLAWILYYLSPLSTLRGKILAQGLTLRTLVDPDVYIKFVQWAQVRRKVGSVLRDLFQPRIVRGLRRTRWVWVVGAELDNTKGKIELTIGLNFRIIEDSGRNMHEFLRELTNALDWTEKE